MRERGAGTCSRRFAEAGAENAIVRVGVPDELLIVPEDRGNGSSGAIGGAEDMNPDGC
ncbi:hypothetical protein BDK51DRAFT_42276 [Blyttiomyces helicus]|uniref:Uncharacterized protein n=1 Tax=Blyttiomyces helicus TaxID=388810 RepID=A0A4P9W7Q6_9FUNG|nr:hypothetical protein BDK51DRAFT_42276 [Blyttiomyces helicus]|eukprot:RKO86186.1 hypothetical protein BDK51DRAFT_42276 [Blyttiomyces helicus]